MDYIEKGLRLAFKQLSGQVVSVKIKQSKSTSFDFSESTSGVNGEVDAQLVWLGKRYTDYRSNLIQGKCMILRLGFTLKIGDEFDGWKIVAIPIVTDFAYVVDVSEVK